MTLVSKPPKAKQSGMLQVEVARSGEPAFSVSEKLLGQNIEMVNFTVAGLLSDRLENPKFVGPAGPAGVPAGWTLSGFHSSTFKVELTEGMGLAGNESVWMQNSRNGYPAGLVQAGRSVRAGETLVVDFWAKAISHPVKVSISLLPPELRKEPYCTRAVLVDASYWKNYRFELVAPESTDQAAFQFFVVDRGSLWVDQIHMRPAGEEHLCRDIIQSMASMRVPLLRFPGGCLSTNYRWKLGTGPVHLRPAVRDVVFKIPLYYDFGTDEYLQLCHEQKITPLVTVNIGSGTPDEAGEWAAYIADFYRRQGQEPPLVYFQMGNEQYGAWETSHMTGAMYVAAMRQYIPAVRANYPQARIIALGQELCETLRSEDDTAWRSLVLDAAGELGIDVLTLSRYKGQWYDDDLDKQINVAESVTKVRHDLVEMIADCRRRGLATKVAITEWNYWMTACAWDGRRFAEDYTVRHALYVAGMLNMFAHLGADMELSAFYHLINPMGIIQHQTADVVESCVVDVFRMYRPAFPGDFVPLEIESPRLGETEAAVDGLCLRQGKLDWVFLCNRHPSQAARVSLCGFGRSAGEMMMLRGDSPMGQLRTDEPPGMEGGQVTLPPLSLLRMRFEL